MPREHGAWVMLLAPIAVGLGATRDGNAAHWVLLTAAASAAFCAREASGLIARGRGSFGAYVWFGIYMALATLLALPLVIQHPVVLIKVGCIGVVMLAA